MKTFNVDIKIDIPGIQQDIRNSIDYIDNLWKTIFGHMTQFKHEGSLIRRRIIRAVTPTIAGWSGGTRIQGRAAGIISLFHVTIGGKWNDTTIAVNHRLAGGGKRGGSNPFFKDTMYHRLHGKQGAYQKPIGAIIFNAMQYGRKGYSIPGTNRPDRINMSNAEPALKFFWKKRGRKIYWPLSPFHKRPSVPDENGVDFLSDAVSATDAYVDDFMGRIRDSLDAAARRKK